MTFNQCELCGAYLDAGERCDCMDAAEPQESKNKNTLQEPKQLQSVSI